MTDGIGAWTNDVHQGDAVETCQQLPESSVHTVMTSPPYWGHRDYGVEGQIGLEDTLDEYIGDLLDVADELRRVLRADGSWWLNLGDKFASRPGWGDQSGRVSGHDAGVKKRDGQYQRKQKMLIPHRVAIALQDAGWIVRSDAVWAKPNAMPHPVKDRFREDKEFLFHLTPEPDYWFDLDAIREPHKETSIGRGEASFRSSGSQSHGSPDEDGSRESVVMDKGDALHPNGKNPGDVLEITVKPFPDAHFAVYPPELPEVAVKSSCPPTVCADCGTPYERVVEITHPWDVEAPERDQLRRAQDLAREAGLTDAHFEAIQAVGINDADWGQRTLGGGVEDLEQHKLAAEAKDALGGYFREFVTDRRTPTDEFESRCDCDTDETEPGIVLDPFAGAGTTCLVAKRLRRRFIGIDLNDEYVDMARQRAGLAAGAPDDPEQLSIADLGGDRGGE